MRVLPAEKAISLEERSALEPSTFHRTARVATASGATMILVRGPKPNASKTCAALAANAHKVTPEVDMSR